MPQTNDVKRLRDALASDGQIASIHTYEEDYAIFLARQVALELGCDFWLWTACGGMQEGLLAESAPVAGTEEPLAAFEFAARRTNPAIAAFLDLSAALRDARVLRAFRNLLRRAERGSLRLLLIDHDGETPAVIAASATAVELSLPDEAELESLLRETLRDAHRNRPIEIDLKRSDLAAIVRNMRGLSRRQARRIIAETVRDDQRFDAGDLAHILSRKRQSLKSAGLLEYVETPATLDEIGGLRRLKEWLQPRSGVFGEKAEQAGLRPPRGVLMLGVQGAGKSLCAKAIAAAWQLPLVRMDVGALYDRYVGESERRLRDTLQQANRMSPLILWIDEIEKGFASAASRSSDGGLSQRMFGTLLTWMQERDSAVFIVATANDIEALPPELLRKGRFDEIFFVDLPDEGVRREILSIHLKKRGRDPATFDLEALARGCAGFSGAEIEQAIVSSLYETLETGTLDTERLLKTMRESPPLSVTMAERLTSLRAWAKGRCVLAD